MIFFLLFPPFFSGRGFPLKLGPYFVETAWCLEGLDIRSRCANDDPTLDSHEGGEGEQRRENMRKES